MTAGPDDGFTPLRGFVDTTYAPRRLLWWVIGLSILTLVAATVGWLRLDPSVRARFTAPQVFMLIGLVVMTIGVMLLLARSAVTLNRWGIVVRNGLVVHRWTWYQIDGVRYRDGDPWASVLFDTPGGIVRRPLIGIQRTDGARAERAVADIRARLAASRADQPEG